MAQISSSPNKLLKTIFKNTGYVLGGNTILKVMNFLFSVFVIRRLGDDRFGQYSIVIAFVGIFQIIAEPGISQFVMREIAQNRSKTQSLFWNLIAVRCVLGLISIAVITFSAVLLNYSQEIVLGIFIYTLTFLLAAFQSPLQLLLTANERFDYVTIMNIIGQLLFIVFGVCFLFSGLSYVWLIVAGVVNFIGQIIIGFKAASSLNLIETPVQISVRTWPQLIKNGIPFGIISLSLTIAFSVDTIILSRYVQNNEVGWYNVAYNLIFSILFISSSFKDAMTPSLAKAFVKSPDEVEKWYFRTVKAIMLVSLPIAVGGMLLAGKVVQFLYSESYLPASLALRIIIWDIPFLMFTSFGGNICTVIKQEKVGARIYFIAALSNIGLNLFIIPRFGYLGASATTVLTDLIASFQFYFFLKRKLNLPNIGSIMVRIVIASVGMGLVVYFCADIHLIFSILLGVGLYVILIMALRLIDETEISFIQRIFAKLNAVLFHRGMRP